MFPDDTRKFSPRPDTLIGQFYDVLAHVYIDDDKQVRFQLIRHFEARSYTRVHHFNFEIAWYKECMSNNDPVKSGLNLPKFNSTGTDDTSTDIITPKIDKATFGRRVMLISLLAITVIGMLIAALARTPIGDVLRSGGDSKFAAPEHRVD